MPSSPPRPIPQPSQRGGFSSPLSSSLQLARASVSRDIDYEAEDRAAASAFEDEYDTDFSVPASRITSHRQSHSMGESYRRPSFAVAGPRATMIPAHYEYDEPQLNPQEVRDALKDERLLLRDNSILPPKPQRDRSVLGSAWTWFGQYFPEKSDSEEKPSTENKVNRGPGVQNKASESTPLLANLPDGGKSSAEEISRKWEEAVAAGIIQTTWRREAKTIGRYSAPLVLTFVLQYSLTVASIFTVGHIGKTELAAVSLASMTANITGYSIYQGLVTSLDTLCPQAYGSGHKKVVGLQMQRMVIFLLVITIPIGVIWLNGTRILRPLVPDERIAELAGQYLSIVLIGAPGYACFEGGKRFVQAQGLFSTSLHVLLICAPLNAFLNWFFVWHLGWGFIGAPIAVAIVDILLPTLLALHVYLFGGRECWNGFTKRAFQNWMPMIKLALPGLLMVEAECFACEILTVISGRFGTTALAAQSVLANTSHSAFQIPFPFAVATSTRVANLIGATLPDAAKTSAKTSLTIALCVGIFDAVALSAMRDVIPRLFTNDPDVIALVSQSLPVVAAYQVTDSLAASMNGILRGLGRQEIGGYVQLLAYYVVGLPVSLSLAFAADWQLFGLWIGIFFALACVVICELLFLVNANWDKSVEEAQLRIAAA